MTTGYDHNLLLIRNTGYKHTANYQLSSQQQDEHKEQICKVAQASPAGPYCIAGLLLLQQQRKSQ